MIAIKKGVKLDKLQPQMVLAATIVSQIYKQNYFRCVITGGNEDGHSINGLHPKGKALDFRIRHLDDITKMLIFYEAVALLNDEYDVILKLDHLHVEYDPK